MKTWFQNRRMKWKKGQQTETRVSPSREAQHGSEDNHAHLHVTENSAAHFHVRAAQQGDSAAHYQVHAAQQGDTMLQEGFSRNIPSAIHPFSTRYLVG